MGSRMDKYYKEKTIEESRTSKNKEIYSSHDEEAFEDLSLTSNISVIDTDIENLDIDKLKEYLDERYKSEPRKLQIDIEEEETNNIEDDLIDTKEYDLKRVIEEAHKNKESDYDKERFKKLRDTQYEILKNLNIDKEEEFDVKTIEETDTKSQEKEPIEIEEPERKTETEPKEEKKEKALSDDENITENMFLDLVASDDTEKIVPVEDKTTANEEISNTIENEYIQKEITEPTVKPTINEELEKTLKLSRTKIKEQEQQKEEKLDNNSDKETKTNVMNNTFYTGKYQIKESDLEEFDDLKKELRTGNMLTKILIAIIVIIILIVALFFANKYLHLGLF